MSKKSKSIPASSHPAAKAADTDLVRLVREYEHIVAELKRLDAAVDDHRSSQRASRINFEMAYEHHEKKIEHIRRQQRTLNAQLLNVQELLPMGTGPDRVNATDVGLMSYRQHPLAR